MGTAVPPLAEVLMIFGSIDFANLGYGWQLHTLR